MGLKFIRELAIPVLVFFLLPHASGIAQKAEYPSRPVRFIIPFPPGGGTDIAGRLVAGKLSTSLGQTFVIDNRPGAASTIGSAIAASSAADGYTILMITASYAIAASFYRKLPYDPVGSFDAVSLVASQPLVLVVHPSVKAGSVGEFVAALRAHPGKLNYASGGEGGINHLAAEMLKSATGTRIVHVPYKGAGPALMGLMAGETQMMLATLGSVLTHVRAGKLRAIAVGSARRSDLLPGVPTLAESAVADYEASNWYGVLAPRGTPAGVITQLNRHIVASLRERDVVDRLEKLAFEPVPSTPAHFAAYLKTEISKWARAMKEAGVRQQ